MTLLSPEEIRGLQSLSNSTKDVNFTEVTQQVGRDVRMVPSKLP